ncbi:glycosyltransferase family 4 protein [Patescibacteria group bacterium]|nr:glycosyltransferase family 4 protein [Patescibacteria group bacterium]
MKKVLLATIDYLPNTGGVAKYIGAIKQTLVDDVDVLFWQGGAPSYFKMIFEFYRKPNQYCEVWINHLLPIGTAAYLARVPYTIFLHGKDFDLARRNVWKRFLSKIVLRNAKNIVTNSSALGREVKSYISPINVNQIVVHPCASDDFVGESNDFVLHTKKERIKIITVSRLVERKGHIRVIEAIADLPNVEYIIVGEGPFSHQIKKEIERFKVEDRVRLISNVQDCDLPEIYRSADVFVMPTVKTEIDREGFGIVYLEASLFGLPIIASNQPGVDEAVMDRVTGFLVNNDIELKKAIIKLSSDSALRNKMGHSGRAFVLREYTRDKEFSKLKNLC